MSCIVCKRNFAVTPRSSDEKISLFRFPFKNKELFHRWVTNLRLPRGVSITSASRVCALHFAESEIQKVATRHLLRPNAVPTLELYVDDSEEDLGPVYMRHLAKSDIQDCTVPKPRANTEDTEVQNLRPLYESYFAELDIKKLPTRRKPRTNVLPILEKNTDSLERRDAELAPMPLFARETSQGSLRGLVRPDALPTLERNIENSGTQKCQPAYAPYVATTETQETSTRRRPRPSTMQTLPADTEDSEPELMYPLQFARCEMPTDSTSSPSRPNSIPTLESNTEDSEEHESEPLVFRVQSFASGDNIEREDTDVCADPLEVCIKEEPGELVFGDEEYIATDTIIPHEMIKKAEVGTQTDISLSVHTPAHISHVQVTAPTNGALVSNENVRDSSSSTREDKGFTTADTNQERKRKRYYLVTCAPRPDDTAGVTREKLEILYPAYVETGDRLDSTQAEVRHLQSKLSTLHEELTRMQSEDIISPDVYRTLTADLPQFSREASSCKRRKKDSESD